MKKVVKIIFHIDLNQFFAACHMIEEPYLKSKVFVVGGSGISMRGVVSTASYQARKYGIRSGMSLNDAAKRYPRLLVVPVNFKLYQHYSKLFFTYLTQYTKLLVAGSIDEAYLDMTDYVEGKDVLAVAKKIQDDLVRLYQLPVSIGIAPTLFLAKMASDLKKPLGITVIRRKDIVTKILPLPVKDIYGIGFKTYPLLMEEGIMTIGDFILESNIVKILKYMSMSNYEHIKDSILGFSSDQIEVDKYQIPKSISNETSLQTPIVSLEVCKMQTQTLLDDVMKKLNYYQLKARTVTIKFKLQNYQLKTRSKSFEQATNDRFIIQDEIDSLLEEHYQDQPLRLIGVGVSNFSSKKTDKDETHEGITLFNYQNVDEKYEKLMKTVAKIKEKYPKSMNKKIM